MSLLKYENTKRLAACDGPQKTCKHYDTVSFEHTQFDRLGMLKHKSLHPIYMAYYPESLPAKRISLMMVVILRFVHSVHGRRGRKY